MLSTPIRPSHRASHSVDTPGSEVFPGDSASVVAEERSTLGFLRGGEHHGASSIGGAAPPVDVDDGTYLFKFVAPGGTTHRFQARYDSYEFITDIVSGKLSSDPFFAQASSTPLPEGALAADPSDFQLSYFDDDGDLVLMTADRDVTDAVSVARKQGKDRVVVHLRGGKGWQDELERKGLASTAAVAAATKKQEALKAVDEEVADSDSDVEEVKPKHRSHHGKKVRHAKSSADLADELVFGFLAKDQLLPASVALLAAAIVGVFAVSKATGRD